MSAYLKDRTVRLDIGWREKVEGRLPGRIVKSNSWKEVLVPRARITSVARRGGSIFGRQTHLQGRYTITPLELDKIPA
jgi:hypothetical protein